MTDSTFVQRLMAPLRDPLMLVSAHDGTIMALNKPMADLCQKFGLDPDLVGSNYYDGVERLGMDAADSAAYKAAHSEGRFSYHIDGPEPLIVFASAEDSHVLVSAWALERQEQAEWAHDWYSLGLKNAIQMEQIGKQAALAAALLSDVQHTTLEMQRTFAARADLFRRAPFSVELPRIGPSLRPVQ